jgi:hypothetical protein
MKEQYQNGVVWIKLAQDSTHCEHGNETLVSTETGESDLLSNY